MSSVVLPRPAERFAIVTHGPDFSLRRCSRSHGDELFASPWNSWRETRHRGVHNFHTGMAAGTRLSAEQNRQLNSILDDFSRYYDNLLSDGNSRVLQILNSEQKKKFEKMMREHKR